MSLYIHDSQLGHALNPGFRTPGPSNSFHTIDANGLRHSGTSEGFSDDGSVLAVGDSFTYGDEVRDEEAWPAQLQRLAGRRVLNGGVTGYGLDQIVLRTEQLVSAHKPSIVIVSFISDDIERSEASRLWWHNKPWFAIEGNELVLKGVPVPKRTTPPLWIRERIHLVPSFLHSVVGYYSQIHPPGYGRVLAQRLVARLAGLRTENRVKTIVMAQYSPTMWTHKELAEKNRRVTASVLEGAAAHGLATLDTFRRFASEPNPLAFYAVRHLNARGNMAIASLLTAALPALLESQTG